MSKLKRAFSATPNQHRSVLCGSEALADVPRIAANSAIMDVAPTESATAIHDLPDPPFETMHEIGKPMGISVCIVQALGDFSGAFAALTCRQLAASLRRDSHRESAEECLRPGSDRVAMRFEDAQEIVYLG